MNTLNFDRTSAVVFDTLKAGAELHPKLDTAMLIPLLSEIALNLSVLADIAVMAAEQADDEDEEEEE